MSQIESFFSICQFHVGRKGECHKNIHSSKLLLMAVIAAFATINVQFVPSLAQTFPVIYMQDTTVTFGSLVYAGRQINAEYIKATSQLVGDPIDSITVSLQKVGAPAGTAQIGVFNPDLTIKKLFGTVDVSTVSATYREYEFRLAGTDLYSIGVGDR